MGLYFLPSILFLLFLCSFFIFMCVWRILLLAFTLFSHHVNKKIDLN
jgi:hypothetical protein